METTAQANASEMGNSIPLAESSVSGLWQPSQWVS